MSEMFEAVVVCKPEGEVQKLVEALPNALNFLVREVKPFISSVVVQANRDVNFDVDRDKSLALHLSDIFEKSLLILYDNRVGFRFAALYENAELMREYNAQDEIWVLLDDSGESIRDGRTFSLAEIRQSGAHKQAGDVLGKNRTGPRIVDRTQPRIGREFTIQRPDRRRIKANHMRQHQPDRYAVCHPEMCRQRIRQ